MKLARLSGSHSLRARLEAQHKWRGCDAQSMEPCPLPGCWEHGTAVLAAGGSICAGWSLPKSQHGENRQENLLSTETSLQWKQGQEQKHMQ